MTESDIPDIGCVLVEVYDNVYRKVRQISGAL